MKRFYLRFRIMLTTFALGLASVFVFNGSLKYSEEIYVDLPKLKTEKVTIVSPAYGVEIPKINLALFIAPEAEISLTTKFKEQ